MKRTVVLGLLVIAALAVFTTGVVFAQAPQPPAPRGGMGSMHRFAVNGEMGPLHEYMVPAMADALGITAADFEAKHDAGQTAYQIALDLGFTADEIPALLSGARTKALDAAAAAGVISQDQVDWMKSRQSGMGTGNCDGTGQRMGAGMRGWRLQQTSP